MRISSRMRNVIILSVAITLICGACPYPVFRTFNGTTTRDAQRAINNDPLFHHVDDLCANLPKPEDSKLLGMRAFLMPRAGSDITTNPRSSPLIWYEVSKHTSRMRDGSCQRVTRSHRDLRMRKADTWFTSSMNRTKLTTISIVLPWINDLMSA